MCEVALKRKFHFLSLNLNIGCPLAALHYILYIIYYRCERGQLLIVYTYIFNVHFVQFIFVIHDHSFC